VSNQKNHGRQTNATPISGIQEDDVSDSGRSMYATRHAPPATIDMNKTPVMIHMNVRPALGSATDICV